MVLTVEMAATGLGVLVTMGGIVAAAVTVRARLASLEENNTLQHVDISGHIDKTTGIAEANRAAIATHETTLAKIQTTCESRGHTLNRIETIMDSRKQNEKPDNDRRVMPEPA